MMEKKQNNENSEPEVIEAEKIELKHCKNCDRELPYDYRKKYCEHCRNIKVEKIKHVGVNVGTGLLAVLWVVGNAGTLAKQVGNIKRH